MPFDLLSAFAPHYNRTLGTEKAEACRRLERVGRLMSFVVAAACVSGLLLQPVPHVRALRSRAGPAIHAQEGGQLAQLGDQFEAALGSLPAEERYNAVLESLLAKQGNVEPALDLVEEMSIKRVKLSDKATKSLLALPTAMFKGIGMKKN